MKNKKWFIILIVLIVISLIVPTWLWLRDYYTKLNDKISGNILSDYATFQTFILTFWGLIFNLLLVIIAYKAFKNFDVKKQFHNKQLDVVSELSTIMNSMELSNMMYETLVDPYGNHHQISTGHTLGFFNIAAINYTKFELMCVKSKNIENTFPFLRYVNHPLLPKTISEQLKKLYRPLPYYRALEEKNLPPNYVVLYSDNIKKEDFSKDMIYEFYKKPSDFSKDCMELRKSIMEWFKKYGAEDLNI